jgi:hypothetical protein
MLKPAKGGGQKEWRPNKKATLLVTKVDLARWSRDVAARSSHSSRSIRSVRSKTRSDRPDRR